MFMIYGLLCLIRITTMINQYVIYGERHSGTKFLDKLINKNFAINKTTQFGHKHFFRPECILASEPSLISETIFLCIVRNPYDWLMSFHNERHHCGISNAKDIYRFLSKEWSSREPFLGPEILEDRHLYSDRRYKHIFELRSVKLNFLRYILPIYIENYVFVRYEDFIDATFVSLFIRNIQNRFHLIKNKEHIEKLDLRKKYYHKIDIDLLKYINQKIDWKIEKNIGYQPVLDISEFSCPLD
jgi:hypothetical protein